MASATKARKRGRPALPQGEVKAKYVPLRLTEADLKAFNRAMKKDGHKTLSGWIRHTLREAASE